jgi:hypothetical protein
MDDYVLDEVDITPNDIYGGWPWCRAGRHIALEEQEERMGSVNMDAQK